MAVTKLLRIKENSKSDPASGLMNNLLYICDPKKTAGGKNIGGSAGNTPEEAFALMRRDKQDWGTEDGSQGCHYILSFDPSVEVTVETARLIAEEFCSELLGDDYYYLYALHDDQSHLHIHITFDSVSFTTGRKFHSPKGDWERKIQPITDRLCRKYNLPTLDYSKERSGVKYGEWKHRRETENNANRNDYSWHDVIRDDVDEALFGCESYSGFIDNLRKMHYQIRDGKYLSLRPPGKEKAVRTGRLGKGYAKEEIMLRIAGRELMPAGPSGYKTYGDPEEIRRILYYKKERFRGWHMNEFQRQFYRRWRRTYLIRKPGFSNSWMYKRDIVELQRITDCIRYAVDHDIEKTGDIYIKQSEAEAREKQLLAKRSAISTKLCRNEVFKDVREYQKTLGKAGGGKAEPEQARILREKIESRMPLEEALEKISELKDKRRRAGALLKENRKEQKLLSEMERLFFDPIHPDLSDDFCRGIRQKSLEELIRQREEQSYERTGKNKDHIPRT